MGVRDAGHRAGAGNPGHAGPAPLAYAARLAEDGGDTNSKPRLSFGGKHEHLERVRGGRDDDTHQFGDALQVWEEWPALSADERCERLRHSIICRAKNFSCHWIARAGPPGARPAHTGTAALDSLLPPDDAADLIQELPPAEQAPMLELIDDQTRTEVRALLAYAEDDAGGLMNPGLRGTPEWRSMRRLRTASPSASVETISLATSTA